MNKTKTADTFPDFKQQMDQAGKLDQVDPTVAKLIVKSGLEDGDQGDDVVGVSKGSWPASALKPSQTSMVLGKALGMALGMLKSGKVGGDLGALVSKDGHILDGHHRWAATILASGSKGKVGGYGANLPGKELLKVLNVISKGMFNVRGGNPGKGALSQFTEGNVRDMLTDFTENGIGGSFPIAADSVKSILEGAFGSVEEGIDQISKNAKLVTKSVPSWAPDRKQMPVIDPGQVPGAAGAMTKGEVDWNDPHRKEGSRGLTASDHQSLIRYASTLPKGSEERKAILVGLRQVKTAASRITVVPAHGRDYKSKAEIEAAWDAGKDFTINDMSSRWDGKPINKEDAVGAGIREVNVRYQQLRKVHVIRVASSPRVAVQLPSEEKDGKDSYDEDFKAGFKAGAAAYKKDDKVSASDGKKAYSRVSKKHGNWWKDGYSAAIDMARGADKTKPAQIAKKLGLKTARTAEVPMNVSDRTASDRAALIRIASSLPKGSEERRAILGGLKTSADYLNVLKTARDVNFMDEFNELAQRYTLEVAGIVAREVGGTAKSSGMGAVVTLNDGGHLQLEMDAHNVPFMVEVRGSVQPFKSAVFKASGTAKHILSRLAASMPKGSNERKALIR